jgi:hypothetical protein
MKAGMHNGFQRDYDKDDSFDAPNIHSKYGNCDLSNSEIDSEQLHDLSAPRMIYSLLLSPQLEEFASTVANKYLTRGREEAKRIEESATLDELIALMHQRIDPLNHNLVVYRLVEFGRKSAESILHEFEKPVDTAFLELGIRVIHRCGFEYNDILKGLIAKGPRKAYMISLLCMLLGFTGTTEHLTLIWTYYKYFKEQFPFETYSDGPLLGLIEIRARLIEKHGQVPLNS